MLTQVPNTLQRDIPTSLTETMGVVLNVRQYGAVPDLVELTDLAITSGTNVATSAAATFTSADIGKLIGIAGAGTQIGASTTIPLASTIASITDAHTVVLADNAGTTVSGAAGTYGTDNTPYFQLAMNTATLLGRAQVIIPAGRFLLGGPVYVNSNTHVTGQGGRSKTTVLKRAYGAYWDVFIAGTSDPGTDHPRYESGGTTYMWWYDGTAYLSTNIGEGISFSAFFVDGNGAGAGQLPSETPGTNGEGTYRGCGLWIQWVNGVALNDVWVDAASNDGAFIAACRRVSVVSCGFANNYLVRPASGNTRNGLTVAGTQAAVDSSGIDMLAVKDCLAENNEDLGIAIQARSPQVDNTHFGGVIQVTGNTTRGNKSYGIAVEGYSDPAVGTPVQSVIIANNNSESDGYGTAFSAAIALTYESQDSIIAHNVIHNAGARGVKISGRENILLHGNIIDRWNQSDFDALVSAIFIYKESTNPYNIRKLIVSENTVIGDSTLTKSNIGILITGTDDIHISRCRVFDTISVDNAYLSGCGFSLEATNSLIADGLFAQGIAGDGIVATAGTALRMSSCTVMSFAQKTFAGGGNNALNVTGSPAHAEIENCHFEGGSGTIPYTETVKIYGPSEVTIRNCRIKGGTYKSAGTQGTGLLLYPATSIATGNHITDCDGAGIFVDGGVLALRLEGNVCANNGKSASSAQRIGLNVGPNGSNPARHGLIKGNFCYDNQGTATQQEGIHTPTQSNGFFDVVGNHCWGNASSQFNGAYIGSSEVEAANSFGRLSGDQSVQVGYGGVKFRYGPSDLAGPGAPTASVTLGSTWRQTDASSGHSGFWVQTPDGWQEAPIGALTGKSLTLDGTHPFFQLKKSTVLKFELDEDGKITQCASLNIDSTAPAITLKNTGVQKFGVDGSGNVTGGKAVFDGPTGQKPISVKINGTEVFDVSAGGAAEMTDALIAGDAVVGVGATLAMAGFAGGKLLQTNATTKVIEEVSGYSGADAFVTAATASSVSGSIPTTPIDTTGMTGDALTIATAYNSLVAAIGSGTLVKGIGNATKTLTTSGGAVTNIA